MKLVKDKNKTEIFKVQRPIGGSSLEPILVYNRNRSVFGQMPMTQEIAKYMGSEYKIYVRGYIDKDGILQVEEKVSSQRW